MEIIIRPGSRSSRDYDVRRPTLKTIEYQGASKPRLWRRPTLLVGIWVVLVSVRCQSPLSKRLNYLIDALQVEIGGEVGLVAQPVDA
jgi:hypothetical protein